LNILIAGDLVPTKSNHYLFSKGDVNSLIGDELFSIWNSSDIRIFNLEVPLTDKENPILKCGPNLIASTKTIRGIKELNPTLLTLANNHTLDQGKEGLKTTENLLSENNIPYVGIGDNLFEASKPYILSQDGVEIGVYACAEREFTIATENSPGANPFDPLESLDHIRELKNKCDYVIVLYHGGKEHYRYPSPNLQKVCRKMVEKGADLVICQHSHCIGCVEEYKGSNIIYGQGNFLFDLNENEFWNTSLIIKVKIDNGLKVDYIPLLKKENGVRKANEKEADEILSAFYKRSKEILIDGFIEEQYEKFAETHLVSYLRNFAGFGKWMSRIDNRLLKGRLLKSKYNIGKLLELQNFIECEAHRELVIKALTTRQYL
jgi:hypothetical protein